MRRNASGGRQGHCPQDLRLLKVTIKWQDMMTSASSKCFSSNSVSHYIVLYCYQVTFSQKMSNFRGNLPAMEVSHSYQIVHGQAPLRDQVEYCLVQVKIQYDHAGLGPGLG